MKADTAPTTPYIIADREKPCPDLEELIALNPPPFALLRREGGDIDILVGEMVSVESIEGLPIARKATSARAHDLLVVVPYRQIRERGFDCTDDGAPLLAMRVLAESRVTVAEAPKRCGNSL